MARTQFVSSVGATVYCLIAVACTPNIADDSPVSPDSSMADAVTTEHEPPRLRLTDVRPGPARAVTELGLIDSSPDGADLWSFDAVSHADAESDGWLAEVEDPHVEPKVFVEVSHEWGVSAFWPAASSQTPGGFLALFDVDNDGLLDIVSSDPNGELLLLQNRPDSPFIDATAVFGLEDIMGVRSVGPADIDNDGDQDLIVLAEAEQFVLVNREHSGFEDETDAWAASGELGPGHLSLVDFDSDGWLDLYIASDRGDRQNRLLRNRGDRFEEVTNAPGNGEVPNSNGASMSSVWTDVDGDGWQDLWLINDLGIDGAATTLYRNLGPDPDDARGWRFQDVGAETGFERATLARGGAMGDIDNDGDLDAYVTNIMNNTMLVVARSGTEACGNELGVCGVDRAVDLGVAAGFVDIPGSTPEWPDYDLESPEYEALREFFERYAGSEYESRWPLVSWTPILADYDHNGWLDLFVTNGYLPWAPAAIPEEQPNLVLLNEGGAFTDRSSELLPGGLGNRRGAASGDLDGDGDLDIAYIETGRVGIRGLHVLENRVTSGAWLQLELVGTASNRDAVGAVVSVNAGGVDMLRQVEGGHGYASFNHRTLHFGLAGAEIVDQIQVRWPSGQQQTLEDIAVDQRLRIVEPDCVGATGVVGLPTEGECPRFVDASAAAGLGRLPEIERARISIFGGVAALDANLDGHLDIVALGDQHHVRLLTNRGDGTFVDNTETAGLDGLGDFLSVAYADIENDGDPDLYLITYERPWLFMNDGSGHFQDITEEWGIFPSPRGGTAAFVDFDNDGLIDLYEAAWRGDRRNHLYWNRGGRFEELPTTPGDGTSRDDRGASLGIVWSDFDRDGLPDLWLINDYGSFRPPSTLFRNMGSHPTDPNDWLFEDIGLKTGFQLPILGMGGALGDFDNDRDLDAYAANIGHNVFLELDSNPASCDNEWGFCASDRARELGVTSGFFENPSEPPEWPEYGSDDENPFKASLAGFCETYCEPDLTNLWALVSWAPVFADFDHNGWLDLLVSNGGIGSSLLPTGQQQPNLLYLNDGGEFTTASIDSFPLGWMKSRGAAVGDTDSDGDLDLVIVSTDRYEPAVILLENRISQGNWLRLDLVGTISNRDAIGARVTVTAGDLIMTREVEGGWGYASANERAPHFGLGEAVTVDLIEIVWPSGLVQTLHNVESNQRLIIEEPPE